MTHDFKDIWGNLTFGAILLLLTGLAQPLVANFGLFNLPFGLVSLGYLVAVGLVIVPASMLITGKILKR